MILYLPSVWPLACNLTFICPPFLFIKIIKSFQITIKKTDIIINQAQSLYISVDFCTVRKAILKLWSFTLGFALSLPTVFSCIYLPPKVEKPMSEFKKKKELALYSLLWQFPACCPLTPISHFSLSFTHVYTVYICTLCIIGGDMHMSEDIYEAV